MTLTAILSKWEHLFKMANIITAIRIVCSIALLLFPAFSPPFYTLYIAVGISDMIDGTVARKTGTVSALGSKLDTAADFIFVVCCLIKLLPVFNIPTWLYCMDRIDSADKDSQHHFRIQCTKKAGGCSFNNE